jgi:hypothetical protein
MSTATKKVKKKDCKCDQAHQKKGDCDQEARGQKTIKRTATATKACG